MFFTQSAFNLLDLTSTLNNSIQPVEDRMNQLLQQIQSNPETVSQTLMMALQAEVQIWASLVNTESSVVKQFGDVSKQVANNIGT